MAKQQRVLGEAVVCMWIVDSDEYIGEMTFIKEAFVPL